MGLFVFILALGFAGLGFAVALIVFLIGVRTIARTLAEIEAAR